MALLTTDLRILEGASGRTGRERRWSALLLPCLAATGAATVIVGSYSTWATFYAGLIARNGVAGHGKYLIGLAIAGALAVGLAQIRGVWPGVRWLATAAGVAIAATAARDLHNLDALVSDPAAAFYVPGRGDGLFIIVVGAVILGLAPFARPVAASAPSSPVSTALGLGVVAGLAMLVPGLYGEYYLHLADGHAHGHAEALNPAHLLSASGALLLVATGHLALVRAMARRP